MIELGGDPAGLPILVHKHICQLNSPAVRGIATFDLVSPVRLVGR